MKVPERIAFDLVCPVSLTVDRLETPCQPGM